MTLLFSCDNRLLKKILQAVSCPVGAASSRDWVVVGGGRVVFSAKGHSRGIHSGGRGPTFQRVGYGGDGDSFGSGGDRREVAAADEDGAGEMNDEGCLEQRDARAAGFRSAGSRRRCPPYPLCRKGRLSLQDRAGGSGPGIEIPAPGGRRPCAGKHGKRRRLRRLSGE